ncbi:MAG: Jag N-terminal domain-containing protein [Helicobacteraceae bacterium]|nr:Jag N-terminal domain-containing protein [Helicobacteraceae bacterium]
MKKIEASTLEEAYTKAAREFNCSVTDLEVQVISEAKSGFLGFFKRPAVIVASRRYSEPSPKHQHTHRNQALKQQAEAHKETHKAEPPKRAAEHVKKRAHAEEAAPRQSASETRFTPKRDYADDGIFSVAFADDEPVAKQPKAASGIKASAIKAEPSRSPSAGHESACAEIEKTLQKLFKNTSYKISTISVSMHDDKTVRVFIDGEDAALLIGKDGYRYKALSYILFNWINPAFGYLLRLEVAEFLQNQEEMIMRYLEPLIARIKETGKGQTRVLDGVLVQIALKELRERFPGKYVAVKMTQDGEGKFVVINDFIRKNER